MEITFCEHRYPRIRTALTAVGPIRCYVLKPFSCHIKIAIADYIIRRLRKFRPLYPIHFIDAGALGSVYTAVSLENGSFMAVL